nr:SpoIIE family protein phosphatase [Kineococcus aurantiacus]
MRQLPYYVQVFRGPDHVNVGETDEVVALYGDQRNVGRQIADYLTGAEGQGLIEMLDRVYAGERLTARGVRFGVVTAAGSAQEVFADMDFLPLRDASGHVVGSIASGHDVTDQVRADHEQAAEAVELSRRYRRATDVIEEVQRALLPARLPVLPGVEVAASYVVGGAEQAAGGDWFDVLARPDGTVAAVVGDVVGHGVAASAVMAQLRAVALERLDAGADPAQVVTALDRFTRVVPAARSATVCVLVLGPDAGSGRRAVAYCAAGHPPPLVLNLEGGSRYLDPSGAPPLGHTSTSTGAAGGRAGVRGSIGPRTGRSVQHAGLGAGELVLLYTDGIVERPGVAATVGTVELAQVAAAAAADGLMPVFTLASAVDRVSVQTLERLTRETGSVDDVTLLALQPVTPSPDLHLHTHLTRSGIPAVRAALRRWLGAERVALLAVDQLDEVVSELLENVVEHAYGSPGDPGGLVRAEGGGPVTVHAHLDDLGLITLSVADEGTWVPRPEPVAGRGLGLTFAQDFAEQVHVESSAAGSTVTVVFRPWKSPRGAAPVAPRRVPGFFDTYTQHHQGRSVVTVRGPVDAANAAELDSQLALSVVPGAAPVQVDLQEVTVLSSAALHALRRRLDQAERVGVQVSLLSSPGTVAQQVLALAGMDTGPGGGTGTGP